jgi:hypothetical protein
MYTSRPALPHEFHVHHSHWCVACDTHHSYPCSEPCDNAVVHPCKKHMTPSQKFVADILRNVHDHHLLAMPAVESSNGAVILMNDPENGGQFWFTAEQRDEELARRAASAGCMA